MNLVIGVKETERRMRYAPAVLFLRLGSSWDVLFIVFAAFAAGIRPNRAPVKRHSVFLDRYPDPAQNGNGSGHTEAPLPEE